MTTGDSGHFILPCGAKRIRGRIPSKVRNHLSGHRPFSCSTCLKVFSATLVAGTPP